MFHGVGYGRRFLKGHQWVLGSYEVLKSGENSEDHMPAVDSNGRWQWGWS